jgi:hypothetical protein
MEKPNSSTPKKAAAARANGRKGGTKNPDISRWNAVRHALNARLGIREGKHLPEYGEYAALHTQLVRLLSPLSVEDLIAIDKFIVDAWRLRRAFRFEVSATEKPDADMLSPGMPNLLRYLNSANRQFAESYARIKEICERKQTSAGAQLAAAVRDFGVDQLTSSQPAAADTSPQSASESVEPLDTTPATGDAKDALEGEEPRHSALPVPSAFSERGNGAGDTPHEAVQPAAAEAATPAPSHAAVSWTKPGEDEG